MLPGFATGLLVAVGLAGLALAYPLWFQFAGPQSVPNGMFSPYYFSADLASFGGDLTAVGRRQRRRRPG